MLSYLWFCGALALGGYVLVMRWIFALPPRAATPAATPADPAQPPAPLAVQMAALAAQWPDRSGLTMLRNGADAFAARIHLARIATQSIDAQYYIWDDDLTGIRLLSELLAAARRGVRVRLLVDDNGTSNLDAELAALNAQPSAEVRLFNPFVLRRYPKLNYSFDFFRLNRRMHNKSFTVDGAMTILGGRNIGDVYFQSNTAINYIDLDVLAVGPAATLVSADFARYWDSPLAYPAAQLIPHRAGDQLDRRDTALRATPQGRAYQAYVRDSPFVAALADLPSSLLWVRAQLFSDDPAKVLGGGHDLLIHRLLDAIGTPKSSLDLISAYFIPGRSATRLLTGFAAAGVRVRTLTNALESTDVAVVHGGYAPYRRDLVAGGVQVFELRSDGGKRRVKDFELFDLSKAALHAKGFVIDRKRLFIGSLNFDPRSRHLNTEMGLLIDSPQIAAEVADWLDANLPSFAYRVTAGAHGLIWTGQDEAGADMRFTTEPNTSLPLRLMIWAIGRLPFQGLL